MCVSPFVLSKSRLVDFTVSLVITNGFADPFTFLFMSIHLVHFLFSMLMINRTHVGKHKSMSITTDLKCIYTHCIEWPKKSVCKSKSVAYLLCVWRGFPIKSHHIQFMNWCTGFCVFFMYFGPYWKNCHSLRWRMNESLTFSHCHTLWMLLCHFILLHRYFFRHIYSHTSNAI